jgi:acetyl-CoA carboxylase biotin carboxyl carrier protein
VNLSAEDVREILRLLDAIDADELRVETERFTLTLRRAADGGWTQEHQVRSSPNVVPSPAGGTAAEAVERPGAAARPGPAAPPESPSADGLHDVRAPLPGTFYRAPSPGAAPFVEAGSRVEADTVVGIVETMKLMNSVLAGVRGTVAEVCVANAQFAAQDAVLLRIEPEAP